jgi:hypothetical protein
MKNISQSYKSILRMFYTFHVSIIAVLTGAGLIIAVLTLVSIMNNSHPGDDQDIGFGQYQTTIQQLNTFHQSHEASAPTLPSGTINPFVE